MRVGVNYPWLHCGWDFGRPPPCYGSRAGHFETIASDLARLAACGVSVVRWFVLADGFVCGTGQHAPQRRGAGFRFGAELPIEQPFLDDFERLLVLCASAGVQLLPVLLDFHWGFPGLDRFSDDARTLRLWDRTPGVEARSRARERSHDTPHGRLQAARERAARLPEGYVKGGRRDVFVELATRWRFFDNVLMPLLQLSRRHASTIYAWELLNEPEWITASSLRARLFSPLPLVPLRTMKSFLREGLALIRAHGFLPTVGFARAATLERWDRPALGLGLNQIHYYPQHMFASLHDARFRNGMPCVLGELASDPRRPRAWPDLPSTHQQPSARLSLASQLGYQAALLWSYRAEDRATARDREATERSIAEFVQRGRHTSGAR